MINQLRELVQRYVAGVIDYRAFRQQLAPLFVAGSDSGDANIEHLLNSIESRCAALDHALILESRLKFVLGTFSSQAPQFNVPQNVSATVSVVMTVPHVVGIVQARAATSPAAPLPSFGRNSSAPLAEPELEEATV